MFQEDVLTGVIQKGIGGFYYVKTPSGIYQCRAKGIFRKKKIVPTVGDIVDIELGLDNGWVANIHPRKNMLIRPPVANVDQLIIVLSAYPEPDLLLLDKMIVVASVSDIDVSICINKTDLGNVTTLKNLYEKAGYKVFTTCAIDNSGIDELSNCLKDKVTAFAGNSGVGKSSVLNAVTGLSLQTGVLSEKISRGKHTTRHTELIGLPFGGFVFDTPGFSSYEITELNNIVASDLQNHFRELSSYVQNCRFRGCSHTKELGCSVLDAVNSCDIAVSRHNNYVVLYNQLNQIKEWER